MDPAFANTVRDLLSSRDPFDPDRLDRRDPGLIRGVLPLAHAFNRHYVSLRVDGLEHLPAGPAVLVGNHNGGIAGPDLSCTLATLWETRGPDAPLYALAHDFAMRQFTPLGRVLQRFGAIRAAPANAIRAIEHGAQVLVYPGGDLDAYRPFWRRHEVIFGPRAGFVRIAQKAGVPIVPIVAHGAHRSAVIVSDGASIARAVRLKSWARVERFPIALALPFGLALGPWTPYVPLPFRITLRILPPIVAARTDAEADVAEHVRASMQRALHAIERRV